jgi:hypothetical protein
MRNTFKMLAGKLQGKRPLRKLRRGWKDNIEIDGSEVS